MSSSESTLRRVQKPFTAEDAERAAAPLVLGVLGACRGERLLDSEAGRPRPRPPAEESDCQPKLSISERQENPTSPSAASPEPDTRRPLSRWLVGAAVLVAVGAVAFLWPRRPHVPARAERRSERPARHHRHAAGGCARVVRRAGADAEPRPAGRGRRAVYLRARARGRDASVAHLHPHRPAAVRAWHARQQRVSRQGRHRHARHAAQGGGLCHGRVRRRVSAHEALRAHAGIRRLRRSDPRARGGHQLHDAGAPGGRGRRTCGRLDWQDARHGSSPGCTCSIRTRRTSRRPISPRPTPRSPTTAKSRSSIARSARSSIGSPHSPDPPSSSSPPTTARASASTAR